MALAALLKSSGTTLMTTIAITAIGFITSVITARVLGPEGRGLLSGALLIATLAANVSLFGLANSFIYHKGAGRPFNYRVFMSASLIFIVMLSVAISFIGLQITDETQLHDQVVLILCVTAVTAAQGYFYALSQLHNELRFFNLMRVLLVVGNLAFLLILLAVYEVVDFRLILITQLLVTAGIALLGIAWAKKHKVWEGADSNNPPANLKGILGYGVSHHGTVALGLLLVNFDKITLLHMGTIVEYGFYALAFTTSRLIGAVQEAVSTALYSRFAGKDVDQLSHHVRVAFRMTFLPMLLLAGIGAILSPWLVVLAYGDSFAPVIIPFAVLLFECVISGASWTLAQRFNAGGRPGLVFVRQFISVLPVFMALPFLPEQNIHVYLSLLMLVGAILRLSVTLGIYPWVLKEKTPDILPTLADLKSVLKSMLGFLGRNNLGQAKT
jgi:O-antigen/teichoic acid export membrane protein